jgi:short-subunit dehydrogenase
VARSHNALIALKEELESAHGISATVIVADLAVPGAAQKVFAATEGAGLHIKNLVNNAGVGGHGKFHERDLASDEAMMQVDMTPLVDLTHLYLQGIVSRKSGRILHVVSPRGSCRGRCRRSTTQC